jgi:hypothetical protein
MRKKNEMFEQKSLRHYVGIFIYYFTLLILLVCSGVELYIMTLNLILGGEFKGIDNEFYNIITEEKGFKVVFIIVVSSILNISTLPFVIIRDRKEINSKWTPKFLNNYKSDSEFKSVWSGIFFKLTIFYSFLFFYYIIEHIDTLIMFLFHFLFFLYFLISWIVVSKTKVDTDE